MCKTHGNDNMITAKVVHHYKAMALWTHQEQMPSTSWLPGERLAALAATSASPENAYCHTPVYACHTALQLVLFSRLSRGSSSRTVSSPSLSPLISATYKPQERLPMCSGAVHHSSCRNVACADHSAASTRSAANISALQTRCRRVIHLGLFLPVHEAVCAGDYSTFWSGRHATLHRP